MLPDGPPIVVQALDCPPPGGSAFRVSLSKDVAVRPASEEDWDEHACTQAETAAQIA
jgi:hypothetical protein